MKAEPIMDVLDAVEGVRERPILFSAPMVRAILAGTKTQTRRVVKWRGVDKGLNLQFSGLRAIRDHAGLWALESDTRTSRETRCDVTPCPYGAPGDRLWVRETFYCDNAFYPDGVGVNSMWRTVDGQRVPVPVEEQRKAMFDEDMYYRADGDPDFEGAEGPTPWRPSIHMPRWASRITLNITSVRVERLQAISEADAMDEGAEPILVPPDGGSCPHVEGFRFLWESINGADSWDANPWVWVVSFQRIAS